MRDVNLSVAHMLSGPIEVEGAEPGDLLVVDILDLGPCQPPQEYGDAPGQGWGYTGIFAKANGGGFLTDHFPDAYKAIWDFHGQDATSRHIPGRPLHRDHPPRPVRHRALGRAAGRVEPPRAGADRHGPGPGARRWRCRRWRTACWRARCPGAELDRVGREGARTVPARENGGNHDIKNFTRGSRVYYPVHVAGAKLSGGDLHFSQGDGEITFCGAIEMGGFIDFGVDLIKGGMAKYGITTNPMLIPGRVEPRYSEFLTFIGVSVDETSGENYYLDATVAYRRACLNAVEYLKKFGYSGEQAYLLLGSAPIEGRVSRRGGHPERLLLAVPADGDLRLRHAAQQGRARVGRPRVGREDQLSRCRSTSSRARSAAGSRRAGRWPGRVTGPAARPVGGRRGGSSPRPACPSWPPVCGGRCRRRRPARTSPASSGRSADGRCRNWRLRRHPHGFYPDIDDGDHDRLRRR